MSELEDFKSRQHSSAEVMLRSSIAQIAQAVLSAPSTDSAYSQGNDEKNTVHDIAYGFYITDIFTWDEYHIWAGRADKTMEGAIKLRATINACE